MQTGAQSIAGEIADLFGARTPIIYLATPDEERAIAICKLAAGALKAQTSLWSLNRGLVSLAPDAREPLNLLEAIQGGPAPCLYILLDFQQCWIEPLVMRRLRDLLPTFTKEGRFLVVVAPRLDLPDSLASDTAALRLPLPDHNELSALLSGLCKVALPPGIEHRAVTSIRAFLRAGAASLHPSAAERPHSRTKSVRSDHCGKAAHLCQRS
jgi:hypothetical protein